ncbi:type II toxin-antitoxin system RelE/ParE family toxin [Epilithonimonas sp.]|uniref:type II toxin-antitoxin system RelE/ParE family toxin n=1 Tax=Epilithonimonas sp. TaxID=2894511 RepID=UPI00289C311C|nr:type II toxin-antitoxin system RelE/ParE family toxin [Epilithonimonas sp.]
MKNIYDILWTPNALNELEQTIDYLEKNFSEKEVKKLAEKIESTIQLISKNPILFPKSENKNIHKAVLLKYNSMYYWIKDDNIEILSFFSNRQNPNKRKA